MKPLPPVAVVDSEEVALSSLAALIPGPAGRWQLEWDDLEIQERVGVGNFAEVYAAFLKRRRPSPGGGGREEGEGEGDKVAVKRFMAQQMSAKQVGGVAAEAALLDSLRHPRVCAFVGVVTSNGNLSIVTEHCEHGNLHAFLKRRTGHLSWHTRVRMALDLAEAVTFLHAQQPPILHLDIKTPNLLVASDFSLRVADFGLACPLPPQPLPDQPSSFQPGTVHWMAPELMSEGRKHPPTDVYAIGVVLWELWTHKTPYARMKVKDIPSHVRAGNRPALPATVTPPEEENETYKQLMLMSWHQDYSLRPSASSLVNSLSALLASIPAPPIPDHELPPPPPPSLPSGRPRLQPVE